MLVAAENMTLAGSYLADGVINAAGMNPGQGNLFNVFVDLIGGILKVRCLYCTAIFALAA